MIKVKKRPVPVSINQSLIIVCFFPMAPLIGVLLSGANADGAEGLKKMQKNSVIQLLQQPATAEVDHMPQQAINLYKSHYCE